MSASNHRQYEGILKKVLLNAREQAYKGYNKHDGLNSALLRSICGWSKWTRIIAIQLVMRFPLNIRPLLGVKKTYNPKGLALFVQAHLDQYERTNSPSDLELAESLLQLLMQIKTTGSWSGTAWGYHYPWQDTGFFAAKGTPNAVVTSFVCEAFLDAYRITKNQQYLDIVGSSVNFFLNDLTILKDTKDELCLAYMPVSMTMRVMDVSILVGAVVAQYAEITADQKLKNTAWRLINYVIMQQTESHAWFYTDPPRASHITHDNYHTGFILDALWRYMNSTGDETWKQNYYNGLYFYATKLFSPDGAPRWMHNVEYPHDIHGAAQGILTFSRHSQEYPGLADKITEWAVNNMYDLSGNFYYQQRKFFTSKFTLLRWCNGWMCRALSRYLLEQDQVQS